MNGYWHCSMAANMTKREATRCFLLPGGRLHLPLIKHSLGGGGEPESHQASLAPTTNSQEGAEHVKRCCQGCNKQNPESGKLYRINNQLLQQINGNRKGGHEVTYR